MSEPANQSTSDYQNLISETYGSGKWFRVSYDATAIMPPGLALYWSFLVNLDCLARNKKNFNGWFKCTLNRVNEKLTLLSYREEKNNIQRLENMECMVTKRMGSPPCRYFKLDLERFRKLVLDKRMLPVANDRYVPVAGYRSLTIVKEEVLEEKPAPLRGPVSPNKDNMVFFPELSKTTKTSKWDAQWAKELRAHCVRTKLVYTWSPTKWQHEFRQLRKLLDIPTIQSTLDWYCTSPEVKLPIIVNAKQFRKNWQWIYDQYTKYQKNNPEVTVSDTAKLLVQNLKMQQWPKGSAKDLPVAVQATLNGYGLFRSNLSKVAAKYTDVPTKKTTPEQFRKINISRAAQYLQENLPQSYAFADMWFTNLHNQIKSWDAWNGNLMNHVFTGDPNHQTFSKYVQTIFAPYSLNPSQSWSEVLKELK